MKTIKSHSPSNGNKFFYVETEHGFMCSFTRDFEDVWFSDDLDTDTPIEGPDAETIEELVAEITA
jgi:hypothetical protein